MNTDSKPPVLTAAPVSSIRYALTRGDILRWQFYVLLRNRIVLGFGLLLNLLLVWQSWQTPELATHSLGFKVFYAGFMTVIFFGVMLGLTMAMLVVMVWSRKHRGFLGEHEMEIRPEGLVERIDVNETLHRWSGFHKVVQTARYLYIYVTDNNVHIVPRRCFPAERELHAFVEELRRHLKP